MAYNAVVEDILVWLTPYEFAELKRFIRRKIFWAQFRTGWSVHAFWLLLYFLVLR